MSTQISEKIRLIIESESDYQQKTLSLIASDNYASERVLSHLSSPFNNKCAEFYPNSRTYAGLKNFDEIEQLAIDLSKNLFKCRHANIQPYSGSNANLAVMNAFLDSGDRFLAMSPEYGGHYSHGEKNNLSSHFFDAIAYQTNPRTHTLDYDQIRDLAIKYRPKLIISGASFYPREIDFDIFGQIAKEVGAVHLSDVSHISGLIVSGLHSDPIPDKGETL